jgi:hypothetical protein
LWFCSLARIFSLNFSATGAARSWIFCWVRSLISSFGTRSLSFSRLLVLRSCFHFLRQGFGAGGFSLPSAPGFWRPVRQVFLVPHQFFLGGFLLPRAQIQFAAENFFHCCWSQRLERWSAAHFFSSSSPAKLPVFLRLESPVECVWYSFFSNELHGVLSWKFMQGEAGIIFELPDQKFEVF